MAVLMFSSVSCKSDGSSGVDSTSEQSQSIEYKTIEPPEDGCTIEELLSVTYLCDKQLSYPLMVESLPDGLELDIDNAVYTQKGATDMYYNGKYFGNCLFTVKKEPLGMPERIVFIDVDKRRCELTKYVVANGISIGDSTTALYSSFGTPDYIDEISSLTMVRYYDKNDRTNGCLLFTLDTTNDTVIGIGINLKRSY